MILAVVYPTPKELSYLKRLKREVIILKIELDGVYYEAGGGFRKFERSEVYVTRPELITVKRNDILTEAFALKRKKYMVVVETPPSDRSSSLPPSPSF